MSDIALPILFCLLLISAAIAYQRIALSQHWKSLQQENLDLRIALLFIASGKGDAPFAELMANDRNERIREFYPDWTLFHARAVQQNEAYD